MSNIASLVAGSPLRLGSSNRQASIAVQHALHLPETGVYDRDITQAAVEAFQRLHHFVPVDGVNPKQTLGCTN